jgi:hypothetical protein
MLHLPETRAIKHLLAYLVPAVVGALALARWRRANFFLAVVALPGTAAHEILHFVVGFLAGARPISLSFWPHRAPDGRYVYGVVAFENLRWWNAAPASLAPLRGYVIAPGVAWLRIRGRFELCGWDLVLWFGLAQLLAAAWPSRVDWRHALRSWPLALMVVAAMLLLRAPH